jgi:hypothetical protein
VSALSDYYQLLAAENRSRAEADALAAQAALACPFDDHKTRMEEALHYKNLSAQYIGISAAYEKAAQRAEAAS